METFKTILYFVLIMTLGLPIMTACFVIIFSIIKNAIENFMNNLQKRRIIHD